MKSREKSSQKVLVGLDLLTSEYQNKVKDARVGLLYNQASVDKGLCSARDVISSAFPGQLKVLFGPQHGRGGEDQDNMVETSHEIDPELQIPVFSLYSETREPTDQMLEQIDILIIDLQDVGARVYTFASTMLNCLRAVSKQGKKVMILDRPNPLGGEVVEGNLLENELFSFVGPWRLPMRHGLTMAEMALLFKDVFKLDCDLEIVPMKGWRRDMLWPDTGLRWIMPSPNMPFFDTALVYPGQVIWEGTNLSEGRGTCRPFEVFGAPFLNPKEIKTSLSPSYLEGCILQEFRFRPTFHKWIGALCKGFHIHVLAPKLYKPYRTSLALLQQVLVKHREYFEWRPPPYEYEDKKLPIDLILGSKKVKTLLQQGASVLEMESCWEKELKEFLHLRAEYLIY